jgi:hypothetical protein
VSKTSLFERFASIVTQLCKNVLRIFVGRIAASLDECGVKQLHQWGATREPGQTTLSQVVDAAPFDNLQTADD